MCVHAHTHASVSVCLKLHIAIHRPHTYTPSKNSYGSNDLCCLQVCLQRTGFVPNVCLLCCCISPWGCEETSLLKEMETEGKQGGGRSQRKEKGAQREGAQWGCVDAELVLQAMRFPWLRSSLGPWGWTPSRCSGHCWSSKGHRKCCQVSFLLDHLGDELEMGLGVDFPVIKLLHRLPFAYCLQSFLFLSKGQHIWEVVVSSAM